VTIQALGWWPNGKFQPLTDDISSVSYWYQSEPHKPFRRFRNAPRASRVEVWDGFRRHRMHAQKSSGIGAGLLLGVLVLAATQDGATPWTSRTGDYALSWDLHADVAQLVQTSTGRSVWHGPLLPGFWLQAPGGERRFVKAEVDPASIAPGPAGGTLGLRLPGMGGGALRFSVEAWGIRFHELRVTWDGTPPAILGLYFGSAR